MWTFSCANCFDADFDGNRYVAGHIMAYGPTLTIAVDDWNERVEMWTEEAHDEG